MRQVSTLLAAIFTSAAMVFTGAAALAMPFQQFDHMAARDRQDYMNFLPKAAETVLRQQGRDADAAKVHQLFTEIHPGDVMSFGEMGFEENLDRARVADAKRAIQDPNLPRIQVETALAVTLKKSGIEMSPDFLKDFAQLASTFKPQSPPAKEKTEKKN